MDKQELKDRITAIQIIDQLPPGPIKDREINDFIDYMSGHCDYSSIIFQEAFIRGISYSNIEESISFSVTVVQKHPEGTTLLLIINYDFGSEE